MKAGVSQIKGGVTGNGRGPQKFAALSRRKISFWKPLSLSLATPLVTHAYDNVTVILKICGCIVALQKVNLYSAEFAFEKDF